MINTSDLEDGDECYIWVQTTICGEYTEDPPIKLKEPVTFRGGLFVSKDFEVYGSSVCQYKKINRIT